QQDVRVVLLGNVGAGKSASGNTLLGSSCFLSELSASAVTQQCKAQSVTLGGRRVIVVDTPGLAATMDSNTAKEKLRQCLQLSAPGPHVFLLVIPLGRFTQEEKNTVERLIEVFGQKLYTFAIILFTFKENLKKSSIEEYISTAGNSLKQLVQKCGSRYHTFNNDNPGEGNQVGELILQIDKLVAANDGKWYTNPELEKRQKGQTLSGGSLSSKMNLFGEHDIKKPERINRISLFTYCNTLFSDLAPVCHQKLKSTLKEEFQEIKEGNSDHGNSRLLNEIYTELYITEGGSGGVNSEHEVSQIETTSGQPSTGEKPVNCSDLFKDKSIRSVLTKGIAGIGKTVSVQKFILDWAEGKANQDILFIFPLPFKKLNLIKSRKLSLVDLLHHFFIDTKDLKPEDYYQYKIMFIFDGLDECQLPLDFRNNESLFDVQKSASVDVLLTNLIQGNLLPSALLWITSRPEAASQIPPDLVDQVTEIRGFSDPQKDEFFRKRISDQRLTNRIIRHLKSSRSLYIMCHIPVFSWIAATVLERVFSQAARGDIPRTLTQVFTHFLIFQIKHGGQKYHQQCNTDLQQTREIILGLGKLAFQQLEKGNLVFYEEDLRECGIGVREVALYPGLCTQIFREEFGLPLGKVFSFVHLSVQEFLAALYLFVFFISENRNVPEPLLEHFRLKLTLTDYLKYEVDRALQSENGHLDLFLRFLMGLSLESNQTLLRDLLPHRGSISYSREEIIRYIKEKIRENPSTEKSINLFYCLNELGDDSLLQEVQTYLNRGKYPCLSGVSLSPAQWSAVAFMLLNRVDLDVFDLRKYDPSEDCLVRLLSVVKESRKALLRHCSIGEKGCVALVNTLKSNHSYLRELYLDGNEPGEAGVKMLSTLLDNPHCKLEKLELRGCKISERGCEALASAFSSNSSSLKELDLSRNDLCDSGVTRLSAGLVNPHCKLETLRLWGCNISERGYAALASALSSKSSSLRELDLSENNLRDSGVIRLSAGLENSHCKLQTLRLHHCSIGEKDFAALVNALVLNPSHLIELDLDGNKPGEAGMKMLSTLLEYPHCKLEKLQLHGCKIAAKDCAALASALSSCSLRELDLGDNHLSDSGVIRLSAGLENPHSRLEKLGLHHCKIGEKGFVALVKALKSNTQMRELNLDNNKPGEAGVKTLSTLLEYPHCNLEKLQLCHCSIGEKGCVALFTALKSNPSQLRELSLNGNKPGEAGVKILSTLLENPHCKLEKLELRHCSIGEKGCTALVNALKANPSQLRELYLDINKPGEAGVKMLSQ
ncbi:hypothetical protein NFI96_019119, partial [Prochilodus magdalenae]